MTTAINGLIAGLSYGAGLPSEVEVALLHGGQTSPSGYERTF